MPEERGSLGHWARGAAACGIGRRVQAEAPCSRICKSITLAESTVDSKGVDSGDGRVAAAGDDR
jgi:hypothetical protein